MNRRITAFDRMLSRRRMAAVIFLFVGFGVALLAGCQEEQKVASDDGTLMGGVETGFGTSKLSGQEIQSYVMGFADTFANRFAQAADELERSLEDPSQRAGIHSSKINNVLSAYSIAAGQSGISSLLDMIVFTTLQRIIYEEVWQFRMPVGAAGDQMLIALYSSEREIWEIAALVLTDDQQQELHELIRVWRNSNPTQNYVSRVRFTEFASLRATQEAPESGGGARRSLFSLLALDPLSSLDPTTRELRASRQTAERLAYFAKRLPLVLSWYPQQAAYDLTATPEINNLLTNIDEYGTAAEGLVTEVQSWPEFITGERKALVADADELIKTASETAAADLHKIVTAEREAAMEQLTAFVHDERRLAIEQMQVAVREEREATQEWIDSEHVALASLLNELKATLDSGDALANSSNSLLQTYAQLNPPSEEAALPAGPPPTPADYEALLREAAATARELRELTDSVRGVLETDAAGGQQGAVAETLLMAQANAVSVVNRVFWYGLVLLGVFLIGLPIVLIIAGRLRK